MAPEVDFIKRVGSNGANGYTITETYGVRDTTNNACNLGPIAVMNLAGIPKLGASYSPANSCDTADSTIVVNSVSVSDPQSDNVHCWVTVTVGYTQPDEQTPKSSKPHPQHNTSEDPIDWKPELEVRKSPRSVERKSLPFIGAKKLDDPELFSVINSVVSMTKEVDGFSLVERPVQSSAGQLFDPPHQEEVFDLTITIGMYTATWDEHDVYAAFEGSVNNATLRIKIDEWNFDKTFSKRTVKMGAISAHPGYREWKDTNGVKHSRTYWLTQFELHVRRGGWYLDYQSAGTIRVYRDPNAQIPDGIGGFLAAADFPAGTPPTGPIVDAQGFTIQQPTKLGLDGQPELDKDTYWILRYLDGYAEKNFSDPNLGLPAATPAP